MLMTCRTALCAPPEKDLMREMGRMIPTLESRLNPPKQAASKAGKAGKAGTPAVGGSTKKSSKKKGKRRKR